MYMRWYSFWTFMRTRQVMHSAERSQFMNAHKDSSSFACTLLLNERSVHPMNKPVYVSVSNCFLLHVETHSLVKKRKGLP